MRIVSIVKVVPAYQLNSVPLEGSPNTYVSSIEMLSRRFVKYTFLKVDPAWRRLEDERRATDKREVIAACEDFADGHLLRAFSLVATRGAASLMPPSRT